MIKHPGRSHGRLLIAIIGVLAAVCSAGAAQGSSPLRPVTESRLHAGADADGRQPGAALARNGTLERPFGAAFNRRIPADPVIDSRSRAITAYLAEDGAAYANLYDFGTPIYLHNRSTPRVRVTCTKPWGRCDLERQRLPIPAKARPNTGSDAAMVVVQRETGRVFEFWQARRRSNGSWRTSWGEIVSIAGNGGFGSTGSGISRLAGVIRTEEIEAGVIPHALVLSTNNACRVRFRAPATKTDGVSNRSDCIPQGARLQLHPGVALKRLGLSPAQRAVAVALKQYGAYVIDNGAARMAVSFERPTNGNDPYAEAGLRWDYYAMDDIPWRRLRVLRQWDGS